MKTLKFYSLIFIAICLASCGGKKSNEEKEIVVKPTETEVSGDLEGCFTVIDKEYKATGNWRSGIITVEIERTDQDLPFELDGRELCSFSHQLFAANVQVGFGIEFLDEDGNVVYKISANGSGLSGPYDSDECIALAKLKPGKKGTIRFSLTDDAQEAVGFRISTAYQENEASESNSESSRSDDEGDIESINDDEGNDVFNNSSEETAENNNTSSKNSASIDAMLDKYEQFAKDYISFMNRIDTKDPANTTKILEWAQKQQLIISEIGDLEERMSMKQINRLNAINIKILNGIPK